MIGPDPQTLRAAFGAFMTGVTVVTARDDRGAPVGFTANSFTSVSLTPPLLLVCPGRFLSSFDVFRHCRHFAVSILAEGQEDVSNTFARFKGDRFAQVDWTPDAQGMPLIDGAAAHFSCQTENVIEAGDHVILLGEVRAVDVSARRGLGYAGSQYFSLGLERQSTEAPTSSDKTVIGALIEQGGHVLVQRTEAGLALPTAPAPDHAQLRKTLSRTLQDAGLTVALGATYSIYDDRQTGQRHVYVLGRAFGPETGKLGDWRAIDGLTTARFADPAVAAMMTRYAAEYRTRTFGLYIGDDHSGDLAPLQDRT